MECPLCHEPWSYDQHIPRILSCGHTLCESCSKSHFILNTIRCKECQSSHIFEVDREFNETDSDFMQKCINSLSKNFSLLSIINNISPGLKIKEIDLQTCEEHNLPIHSFTEKPESELCDECIQEVKGMGLIIKPLPHIEEYFNILINKIVSKLQKNNENITNVLNQYETCHKFESLKGEKLVSGFFQKLLLCLDEVETETELKLKKLVREEKILNESSKETLRKREILLESLLQQLTYLKSLPESDLVRNSDMVEGLIANSNFQESLSLKNIEFYRNKSKVLKIKNLVETSMTMEIIRKRSSWKCKCGTINTEGVINCVHCEKFRPISTYPNISSQSLSVTEQEVKEINLRRTQELEKVRELNDENPQGTYYLIHSEWVNLWKLFIFSKSKNPLEALPPGPITNFSLFENEECTRLKQNLFPNIDYYPLSPGLWEYYLHNYGGGPTIKRKQAGIYQVNPR